MVTVATFNANNLFVRYRFGSAFPGAPATAAAPTPPAPVDRATTASTKFGFLPRYEDASFEVFNAPQRELAARALTRGGEHPLPDLMVLQEIESLIALRVFNERHLGGHYTQALLGGHSRLPADRHRGPRRAYGADPGYPDTCRPSRQAGRGI